MKFGQDGRIFFIDVSEDNTYQWNINDLDTAITWNAGKIVKNDFDVQGAQKARGLFIAMMLIHGINPIFSEN